MRGVRPARGASFSRSLLNNEVKQSRGVPRVNLGEGLTVRQAVAATPQLARESGLDQFRDAPEIESRCGHQKQPVHVE